MNILTSPSTGAISFNTDAAGSSTVSLTTFPRFQYDGGGGISIISTSTGTGFTDKFKVESSGRLFTVTDATTGVVMDVTNALGLPILEVYSLEPQTTITMGPYGTSAFVLNNTKLGLGTATPAEVLDVVGNIKAQGQIQSIVETTVNYTVLASDFTVVVKAAVTVQLPACATVVGKLVNIKNLHSTPIPIVAFSGEFIDTDSTLYAPANSNIKLQARATTGWVIL